MFYVGSNGVNSMVFDSEDFSVETLPADKVTELLNTLGCDWVNMPYPFNVKKFGEYAYVYTTIGGRFTEIKGYLVRNDTDRKAIISVSGFGDINISADTYPLGITVKFTMLKNGKKYGQFRKFDNELKFKDTCDWRPIK